ncbi:MAG: SixA phosphatase family protein [Nocardioidaceae bacterium]
MSTLLLVRHAKTQPTASSDRERELTGRGRRQSDALGVELGGQSFGSVRALVSSAVRAVQTWEGIAPALEDASVTLEVLESLYAADPDDVLDEVRVVPSEIDTVIVVGHNPAIADLAWTLAGEEPGPAFDAMRAGGYSPATTTAFEVAGAWAELDASAVTLTRYVGPLA